MKKVGSQNSHRDASPSSSGSRAGSSRFGRSSSGSSFGKSSSLGRSYSSGRKPNGPYTYASDKTVGSRTAPSARFGGGGSFSSSSSPSSYSSRGSYSSSTGYSGSQGSRFGGRPSARFGGGGRTPSSFGSRNGGGRGRGASRKERIDISKFIYTPENINTVQEKYICSHKFTDFPLSDSLQKNIVGRGYEHPTPIQDKIIAPALSGKDVLGLANTGSGKTGAFLIPLIDLIEKDTKKKVLIVAPTRELAQQINKELREFTQGMNIFSTVCVGGMPIYRQIQDLKRSYQFLVGTPGRIKDLYEKKCIDFSQFEFIVLDEVDRMLDMGFVDEIRKILSLLPAKHQSLFFSATLPPKIRTLIQQFLKDPVTIDISSGDSTKTVHQDVIKVVNGDKVKMLVDVLKKEGTEKTLIFVETKHEVDDLKKKLDYSGFRTGLLHGGRRQNERDRTLQQFRDGVIKILVATDVAARGIDVKDISHVINYTIPQTHHDYIHRIGRTGRGGKTGKALTFI